jgi:Delta3-Delta2-enoyl-CoA isomerase
MPTLALLNGHAFAGGLMTAMYHDYRVFNSSRGFLCLNELEFGAPLKPPMSAIFREKLAPQTYRSLVLEAKRFPGPQAVEAGIVDALGGLDAAVAFVRQRDLVKKGTTGVYAVLKWEMYREILYFLTQSGFDAEEERLKKFIGEDDVRARRGREKLGVQTTDAKSRL